MAEYTKFGPQPDITPEELKAARTELEKEKANGATAAFLAYEVFEDGLILLSAQAVPPTMGGEHVYDIDSAIQMLSKEYSAIDSLDQLEPEESSVGSSNILSSIGWKGDLGKESIEEWLIRAYWAGHADGEG